MRVRECNECNVSFRLPEGNCECCPYEVSIQWLEYLKKKNINKKTNKNKKEKNINTLDKWM